MINDTDKINQLIERLELLSKKHDDFLREINTLQSELNSLKSKETTSDSLKYDQTIFETKLDANQETKIDFSEKIPPKNTNKTFQKTTPITHKLPISKSDIEKFIGENIINKIGIVITVIGVAIGAKYSIEHDLISPLTRIILGYLIGIGLLGFGIKLKKNYENFSAVLVSGAMAILYFITYSAYGIYNLIPQILAFILMVILTAFTVLAAINYNRQVIAHIGLVGAYAVPFLLSEGSGKVAILFTYMAMINIGILVISFKKYWKSLYYSSFIFTWLIFLSWYFNQYQTNLHFTIAFTFLSLFFLIFYATFIAYKLLKKEKFEFGDILLLLGNSFIFFGLGYAILSNNHSTGQLLGLFTLGNAIVHFVIGTIVYRQNLADKNLFYLVIGLVLVFITIAIPIQLDGSWVTLLWVGEAALLFWIGRTKNVAVYEKLSYPLMILAFISIFHDWGTFYGFNYYDITDLKLTPILNVNFLSSMLFIGSFGFINYLNQNKNYPNILTYQNRFLRMISLLIPGIFIFTLYYAFRLEITNYWNQLYSNSALTITTEGQENYYYNYDLQEFKTIWILNYSLLFVSILSFVNLKKIKNEQLGYVNLILNLIAIFVFLMQGLYSLSELRESYLQQTLSEFYQRNLFNLEIRYLSFGFVVLVC